MQRVEASESADSIQSFKVGLIGIVDVRPMGWVSEARVDQA
jgi:hypothetical protein